MSHLTQFPIRVALYIVQVTRVMDHVFLFYESLIKVKGAAYGLGSSYNRDLLIISPLRLQF